MLPLPVSVTVKVTLWRRVGRGRRPVERGGAVERSGRQRRGGRKSVDGIRQVVLVGLARLQVERERLTDQRRPCRRCS